MEPHVNRRQQLLSHYNLFPFDQHPLWLAVFNGDLRPEQIYRAEAQHYLRTKANRELRRRAATQSRKVSPAIAAAMIETYIEECTDRRGTNHLELVQRLVMSGGLIKWELDNILPTPGNAAAIALYRDIGERGFACHMLGAGAVEFYYAKLAPKIFESYTKRYGMNPDDAETYRVHGPMDQMHADRALALLDQALQLHSWEEIEMSVRDAFVATSLHYDGMRQAAFGTISYWEGSKR